MSVERMQRVGELARLDREIFQHQHESADQGVESRPVCLGHAGEFRRQLVIEAHFGLGEPTQFAHQPSCDRLGRHLDEDRLRDIVAGERQPGAG